MSELNKQVRNWDQGWTNIVEGLNLLDKAGEANQEPILSASLEPEQNQPIEFISRPEASHRLEQQLSRLPSEHPYSELIHQRTRSLLFSLDAQAYNLDTSFKDISSGIFHVQAEKIDSRRQISEAKQRMIGIVSINDHNVSNGGIDAFEPIANIGDALEQFKNTFNEVARQDWATIAPDTDFPRLTLKASSLFDTEQPIEVEAKDQLDNGFVLHFNADPSKPHTALGIDFLAYHALARVAHFAKWRTQIRDGKLLPSAGLISSYLGPDSVQAQMYSQGVAQAFIRRLSIKNHDPTCQIAIYSQLLKIMTSYNMHFYLPRTSNQGNPYIEAKVASRDFKLNGNKIVDIAYLKRAELLSKNSLYFRRASAASWLSIQPILGAGIHNSQRPFDTKIDMLSDLIENPKTYRQMQESLKATNTRTYLKNTA